MTIKEIGKLLERVHKDIDIFDFNGKNVPRIILDDRKFDDIMSKIQGKPISVNTNLNILQDGLGHVFVEFTLDFSHGDIHEEFLIYANEFLEFFESLANTTMFALSPPNYSEVNQDKIFMVQLPKPEKAIEALDIIKNGLRENKMIAAAGADRLQEGMRRAFGKAVSLAARVKRGQCIMEMQVKKEHLEAAKKALKSACVKLPGTPTIRVIPLN